jgi:internalin A
MIPNPEQIISLGSYDTFFVRDLEEITVFKNLEQLYVKSPYIEDISKIKELSKLKNLYIKSGNNIKDFSPLESLTSLEVLDITSSSLDSLDFLKNLDNIIKFSLTDSQVTDISMLDKYKDQMTELCLYENYNIDDYSSLSQFKYLTDLSLCTSSVADMPNLFKMTQLSTLTLGGVYDLSFLSTSISISKLYLNRCGISTLPDLSQLTSLYYVKVNDTSTLITDLTPFTEIPNLVYLDISNTDVYGSINEIFEIPTLKGVVMDNCTVSVDFSAINENDNIDTLSMSDVTIKEYGVNQYGNKDVSVFSTIDTKDAVLSAIKKFPYLTSLYIEGDDMENLDFVSSLPYLEYLDVNDNNISSLKPLEKLTGLKTVWCKDNPIETGADLDDDVVVIYE